VPSMIADFATYNDPHPNRDTGFQFQLRHLFATVTLACVYFAMVTYVGKFAATLVLGIPLVPTAVILLRIDNILFGALAGLFVAGMTLALVQTAFPPQSSWALLLCWLGYPQLGYVLGLLYSADRSIRWL
jgi:hypothetical protein